MKSFPERRAWLVGVLSILLIAAGTLLAFAVPKFEALRGVYRLSADLKDAAGLIPGNEVRVAGVKVGTVKAIELTDHSARIDMELQDDVRIPVETQLEVKLKTLLGQKFVDLQLPKAYLAAAANGAEQPLTAGFFNEGDVIPLDQTEIPFEIYQAANEGTAVLERIDKKALRQMLNLLGQSVGDSREELRAALIGLDKAGRVLGPKNAEISNLLRNVDDLAATLNQRSGDIDELLQRSTKVLGSLAGQRKTISSLLAAANDLTSDLGLLIQAARAPIQAGTADLASILTLVDEELDTLGLALEELPRAQEMFAQPLQFGRFVESAVCAVTTEDTCIPEGTPTNPGIPSQNRQPQPTPTPTIPGAQP